jgi:hypothetical protein
LATTPPRSSSLSSSVAARRAKQPVPANEPLDAVELAVEEVECENCGGPGERRESPA